ncbi:putative proton-dependent oligopeptide transporter family [Medicago truncatula]|uniref:Putative proton-dependent oligopeptide transporter family n=1 Tax=Medicago truncatula TaxID=3880 RepID=A0A396GYS1_MEDTR|nr:putative proton-dependent oligopeptide transporter family [Medicago truncatula]RHN46249.1 putative proton-dependent oligopeptide transporter family [Medicago truncatula]RHN46251.1 putative proton-dependent oligopeptide transporter family [Medicago truncatula]
MEEMKNENESNERQDPLANFSHSSSTKNKKGGWKSVKYILGNETFEKLASMSLIANLVVYMHTQYNMDTAFSVEVFNIWSGLVNFIPLVAAYIADAYVGKFHMLIFGGIASLLVNTKKLS